MSNLHDVKVEYGGADGSCKHIGFAGTTVTVTDLLNMLLKAQKEGVRKVCIGGCQYSSLIDSIRQYAKKIVEG